MCRCCLCCVAWFFYWFNNLGFTSEGNTYRRCAGSSLPLWGNTDVASSDIKRNFWHRCREASSSSTRFQSQISSLRTYIICHLPLVFLSPTSPICLSFSSPPLHQFAVLFASLFRPPFSLDLVTMSDFGMADTDDGLTP